MRGVFGNSAPTLHGLWDPRRLYRTDRYLMTGKGSFDLFPSSVFVFPFLGGATRYEGNNAINQQ